MTLAGQLARRLLTLLLTGLLGAYLVRWAPGFGLDERTLDARLSTASIEQIQKETEGTEGIAAYYLRYLRQAAAGDLGKSRLFDRPVSALIGERLRVTLRSATFGLLAGWLAGLALAGALALSGSRVLQAAGSIPGGVLLCLPAALVGLLLFFAGLPVGAGIAAVIFPKVFFYTQELLQANAELPHVLMARAKGVAPARILLWHVLPPSARPLLALLGITITAALSAAIPVEVVCDSPGIGQLAWRAAQGRDLPLLTGLTLFIAAVTLAANSLADAASLRVAQEAS